MFCYVITILIVILIFLILKKRIFENFDDSKEKDNTFISSRGIMQSCDWFSKNPISSISKIENYPDIDTIKHIKNPIIYVCGSAIAHFRTMMPSFPFILVTGDCDETIPQDVMNDFDSFISNSNILHWFSQNMTINHPKVTKIPIGMDYHTFLKDQSPNEQEKSLNTIQRKPFHEREIKCYSNFHFQMNTKYGQDRKDALAQIPKNLVYYEKKSVPRLQTWNTQKDYAFIISPHGGGYDCHRLWEGLILGCIPIVKTSPIDSLYHDLPVLIVNQWSDITKELLENTIKEFKDKTFNYNKLTLSYWANKMKEIKNQ